MATVPILVGLSRDNAVAALTQAGLIEGIETNVISAAPLKSITRTIPVAGTQLAQGASVDLDVSAGLRRPRWWENPSSFIFSVLGALTLASLLTVLTSSAFRGTPLLEELGKFEVARGLITFLIAFTTVGIAIIIVVSTVVLNDSPENDKRFDRGKQVLSVLIGVLGTIVGFYFAAANKSIELSITSASLPVATVGSKYEAVLTANAGSPPFKWTVTPNLPEGLSLSDPGVISGTPTSVGSNKSFAFKVIDSNGKTDTKNLDLTIQPQAASPPAAATPATTKKQ
jgi:hypothetical protein